MDFSSLTICEKCPTFGRCLAQEVREELSEDSLLQETDGLEESEAWRMFFGTHASQVGMDSQYAKLLHADPVGFCLAVYEIQKFSFSVGYILGKRRQRLGK